MIKYLSWLLLSLFLFLPMIAKADVITPNTHQVSGCTKIIGLSNYPDVELLSAITGPGGSEKATLAMISENKCLSKGYKFNSYHIYWAYKKDLTNKDLNILDISSDKDLKLVDTEIDLPGGYVADTNPLVSIDTEYTVGGVSNNQLIFYKSKQTSKFNNGSPEKTEVFNPSGNVTQENGGGIFDLFNNKYWLAVVSGAVLLIVLLLVVILRRRKAKNIANV